MITFIVPRSNAALSQNPPGGDLHITTHASDWLWTVFAIMLLTWLFSLVHAYMDPRRIRIFGYIPVVVLGVATIAYFSMASDLGWTLITTEFRGHLSRQIWYVRYIQWFINAPLVLLSLLALTSMATPQIITILFFSWMLVVCGLVGALVASSYKWGYYAFGLFSLFFIWYQLLGHVHLFPFRNGDFKAWYFVGTAYISFIWMLYPICWALSEGGNVISPSSEMVFYGILDLFSGPFFFIAYAFAISGFSNEALAMTAFGTTDRGVVEKQPQQAQQPVPQQQQQQQQQQLPPSVA